jgi:hypothetical protein
MFGYVYSSARFSSCVPAVVLCGAFVQPVLSNRTAALQINDAGGVKKLLFNWGFARKLFYIKKGLPHEKVRLPAAAAAAAAATATLGCSECCLFLTCCAFHNIIGV